MIYKVETIKDGTEKYFFIRNLETMSIEELPSKYLMHKIKCKRYRNVRLKSLKLLYDSCVQLNITDIGLLEMEQVETILKNFPETSQRSILGECRRDAFMQQEQIQWEANVWYLERLHLGKHRIDESKSLISISFMEVKEIQNREILQAYMKYELGITGQAVSTIVRRFVLIICRKGLQKQMMSSLKCKEVV